MNKKGKHQTVDKELKPSISWLESQSCVTKVVLGLCESARHAYTPGTLRFQMDSPGGVKLKAYGGNGVIDLYIKVAAEDKEDLLKRIADRWPT
jgi:hypothetical protein